MSITDDEKIVTKMEAVDWLSITEQEASSLGVSIGIYEDARHAHDVFVSRYRFTLTMIVVVCCIIIPGSIIGASTIAMLVSTLSVMLLATIITWLSSRASGKMKGVQLELLLDDIEEISKRHPVGEIQTRSSRSS